MNEELFISALTEAFQIEYEKQTSGEEHKFSLRHKLRMRKVFRLYESSCVPDTTQRSTPTLQRRLIVALIVVFTAIIMTITVVALIANGLKMTEKGDHTEFFAVGDPNAPTTIVDVYEPGWIPDGFELVYSIDNTLKITKKYKNPSNVNFFFHQYTISAAQGFADAERYNAEHILINNKNGIIWNDNKQNYIFWDNGDYAICIFGNIAKETLIKLASSTKIKTHIQSS